MKHLVTLAIFILIGILLVGVLPTHGESEIYDSVLRLHVLANSDSEYDQSLKLMVRDGVLEEASRLTADCKTRDEAVEVLRGSLDSVKAAAKQVIEREGASYDVTVTLGEEEYPTKNYESICFPSGRYMSLRVCIGESEGQNWWCVLFPNLCLSAATKKDAEAAFVQAGLTPEQYKIVTETNGVKYKLRFKFLEALEGLFDRK